MRGRTAALRALAVVAPLALVLAGATAETDDEGAGTADETLRQDDDFEAPATETDFTRSVVATELANPFEVTLGPDGNLWTTERTAGRVTLVDPDSGEKTTILTISDVLATPGEQDGLLGMALHPDLLDDDDNQYDYLSYTYNGGGQGPEGEEINRRQRIVRYTYAPDEPDPAGNTLVDPYVLIENLVASDDHNSGRLIFGSKRTLLYTIGDRGNLQDLNACKENRAQQLPTAEEVANEDWTAYQGKVLRLNLDGSIPRRNPRLDGVRSHVFTYGHRNAQGIVLADDGRIFSSEQGPMSDDELNLLRAGGNYGWPDVAGYQDDSAYVFADWAAWEDCAPELYNGLEIPDAVPQRAEHELVAPNLVPPLRTFYTVPTGHDFTGEACEPSGLFFICFPTVAPSSLDFYDRDAIPGWDDSLLMPALKTGTLFRLPILDSGTHRDDGRESGRDRDSAVPVIDGPLPLFTSVNRYRDTAISGDGGTIYVATDSGGLARGENGDASFDLQDPGAILAFTFDGTVG
jgi:PQQ-dependent dehydrogenase (s-GDH family)